MKDALRHIQHCNINSQSSGDAPSFVDCAHLHCKGTLQIIQHWKFCSDLNCIICKGYQKPIITYLHKVFSNEAWKAEVLSKYLFAIDVLMPVRLRELGAHYINSGNSPITTTTISGDSYNTISFVDPSSS